ncbi:hypothetical protein [Adhaeretor mobilis]|uniref:Uncharacterized protein n=1 Tax=Adhaeretor mobilis TaxID=1930276 RepID=A0A517MWP8_9BACT|nr:hypothetical protein [Adhaeretor mobilis]QDS99237.1 hypothetical protein HG15A2_25590 [Adhaeretor mobilis]
MTEQPRNQLPSSERVEEFEITGGNGILELQGDDFDTALLFNEKPVSMNWCDCHGSVGQYMLNCDNQIEAAERLAAIRTILSGFMSEDVSLAEQLDPLIKLFRDGPYRCRFFTPEEWSLMPAGGQVQEAYPYPDNFLLETRFLTSLNAQTIEKHKRSIQGGRRPIAIVATTGDAYLQHVVDGHHKLHAYKALEVLPSLIEITALEPMPIAKRTASKWIGRFTLARKHYRKYKT